MVIRNYRGLFLCRKIYNDYVYSRVVDYLSYEVEGGRKINLSCEDLFERYSKHCRKRYYRVFEFFRFGKVYPAMSVSGFQEWFDLRYDHFMFSSDSEWDRFIAVRDHVVLALSTAVVEADSEFLK